MRWLDGMIQTSPPYSESTRPAILTVLRTMSAGPHSTSIYSPSNGGDPPLEILPLARNLPSRSVLASRFPCRIHQHQHQDLDLQLLLRLFFDVRTPHRAKNRREIVFSTSTSSKWHYQNFKHTFFPLPFSYPETRATTRAIHLDGSTCYRHMGSRRLLTLDGVI